MGLGPFLDDQAKSLSLFKNDIDFGNDEAHDDTFGYQCKIQISNKVILLHIIFQNKELLPFNKTLPLVKERDHYHLQRAWAEFFYLKKIKIILKFFTLSPELKQAQIFNKVSFKSVSNSIRMISNQEINRTF